MEVEKPKNQKEKERREVTLLEDLAGLEAYIKALWEFLPIAVCYVNPAFNILEVSKTFEDLLGIPSMELIGQNLRNFFASSQVFSKIEKEVSKKGRVGELEVKIRGRGKKQIPVSVFVLARFGEGVLTGYFFAFLDITERKKFEKSLTEKISELRNSRKALLNILEDVEEARKEAERERDKTLAIIENFPEGLLFFDAENKLSSVNPKACEIFKNSEK